MEGTRRAQWKSEVERIPDEQWKSEGGGVQGRAEALADTPALPSLNLEANTSKHIPF